MFNNGLFSFISAFSLSVRGRGPCVCVDHASGFSAWFIFLGFVLLLRSLDVISSHRERQSPPSYQTLYPVNTSKVAANSQFAKTDTKRRSDFLLRAAIFQPIKPKL